jgi:carbonic anhydrase
MPGDTMRLSLISLPLVALSSLCAAQTAANWSYSGKTGSLVWGKLNPSYKACSKGHQQSPIDMRGARLDAKLQPIEFHYMGGVITLENTGNAIVAIVDPGSYIVAGGVRYNLVDFEFHHPSEHTVRGKLADMEVDLIHKSAEGRQAILAVRLNEGLGNPNATIATLWEHLPAATGKQEKITEMIDAAGLLPADRGYWTYTGSELTPPCSEGVSWFVFENDISVSRAQLRTFTNLYRLNTRPLQDPHGRKIVANE